MNKWLKVERKDEWGSYFLIDGAKIESMRLPRDILVILTDGKIVRAELVSEIRTEEVVATGLREKHEYRYPLAEFMHNGELIRLDIYDKKLEFRFE